MARAKHRGTGPSKKTSTRKKLTIGDGSIRDLAYWLTGGDVSVKWGKNTTSGDRLRMKVMRLGKDRMPVTPVDRKNFGAYNIMEDYTGKYEDGLGPPITSMPSVDPNRKPATFGETSMSERQRGEPYTGSRVSKDAGRGRRAYKGEWGDVGRRGTATLMPGGYGQRRRITSPEPQSYPPSLMPSSPSAKLGSPSMLKRPVHPAVREMLNKGINPMTAPPIPERDEVFGDEYGAGFYTGGPVKKRKRKKYMGGGKMRKYAKGGGIRKAKYS